MKTRNLLITLGAAAFAAITINASASDASLSPRAAGNQVQHVSGVNNDANLVNTTSIVLVSPRAAGNQLTAAARTPNDLNPAIACAKNMNGTPKAVAECVSHTTMPGCQTVAVAPLK